MVIAHLAMSAFDPKRAFVDETVFDANAYKLPRAESSRQNVSCGLGSRWHPGQCIGLSG